MTIAYKISIPKCWNHDTRGVKLLSVMFFIHGGSFKSGSGNVDNYGPDFLLKHGVVLVTINYRLDALEFLCLDTFDVPGNAGLKDQVQALKWIKENIAQFGGNPDNVTVFGQSAGGTSTALHVLSPMSKSLFQRAIAMSGGPLNDWSFNFEPRRRAFVLGKILGCDTEDPDILLEFLQSLPKEKLINTKPSVLSFENVNNHALKLYHFTPVVEKNLGQNYFLLEDPMRILQNGNVNEVDILIGHTSQEDLIIAPMLESSLTALWHRYDEMFIPIRILYIALPARILEISDRIQQYYFGDKIINSHVIKELVEFNSDCTITYDIHRFIENFPELKTKRYFYKFSCVSERNIYGALGAKYGIIGAAHVDNLMYLFDAKSANLTLNKSGRSYKMIQQTCKLFTNFAKYGNPTPDNSLGVIWQEYNNNTESYLDINEILTAGHHLDADSVSFWKTIYNYAGISP